MPTAQPSPNELSIQRYRRHAAGYDRSAAATMPLRRQAIALLNLRPGEVVLDVGAGTGLSYEALRQGVAPGGRVLAFEQSPEMFALASERVRAHGWNEVWQVRASAEQVQLPELADAALFNYVHDIGRTPQAVHNILRQLKPGARIVMAGMQYFPWWAAPLNLLVWLKNRPYNSQGAGLWKPWRGVAAHCRDWQVCSTQWGMGYIAWGRYQGHQA